MSRALRARIERLEARKIAKRFPRIVLHVGDREEADLIGYRLQSGLSVMRAPEEALEALRARCWSLEPSLTLAALYRPATAPQTDLAEPSAPLPAAEPWVEPVAGVGRRATRAELERMAAIAVPPERWV